MRNPFFHGVGGVLSADIAVPEHERELRFYSKILTTGSAPLWRDDLSNNQGTPVIGLGARSPEYEALPLQWMPHFQVSDVAASAGRTIELGGQELMHAKGDGGESQWAVLVDPTGAAFGVIPVVVDESNGAIISRELVASLGSHSWSRTFCRCVTSTNRSSDGRRPQPIEKVASICDDRTVSPRRRSTLRMTTMRPSLPSG